jgi:hypothetical protein
MATLGFYHDVRADGGRRTGVEVNGSCELELYEEESGDFDPALLWYVDLSCEGESLPPERELARLWFLNNEQPLVEILLSVADRIEIGFDVEARPFRRIIADGPGGSRVSVSVSAIHRLQAREVATELRSLTRNWRNLLERLVSESLV